MNTFVKVTFAVGIPLMILWGMSDLAATFYRPDEPEKLGYQVVEPEEAEEEVATEEPIDQAPAEEMAEAAPEPAAEPVTEVEAEPVEEAVVEEDVVEAAPEPEAGDDNVATVENDETVEQAADTTEAVEDDQVDIAATEPVLAIALTEDELKQAERSMRKCKTCHQIDRERNAAGPHLVGVMGRMIGGVDGFRYSDALTELGEAGEVWNVENLQAWIENPSAFADGSRMNFKIGDAEERRLIAGWLAAQ